MGGKVSKEYHREYRRRKRMGLVPSALLKPWNMTPDSDPYLTLIAYPFGSNDIGCRPGDSNFNPVI